MSHKPPWFNLTLSIFKEECYCFLVYIGMNHTDVEMNRQGSSSTTLTGSHALSEAENEGSLCPIDAHKDRFPFCIVWTAIPCLTWFFPFVGHMAIADSQGIIYDFAGPYTIGKDDMGTYYELHERNIKKYDILFLLCVSVTLFSVWTTVEIHSIGPTESKEKRVGERRKQCSELG